jgi:predicted nucleotidyltransferase
VRITTALDDVLASRGHLRVLRALDALPEGLAVSVRDVARRAGLAHPRTSQVLASLTELGLARVQRAGRADLYQLNREHLLFPIVHGLFVQEAAVQGELVAFLRRRLRAALKSVHEAYLFGSVARGESRAGSDIDLAVVIPRADLAGAETRLQRVAEEVRLRFGNDLSVHISTQPLSKRVRAGQGRALWAQIAKEGLRIMPATAAKRA